MTSQSEFLSNPPSLYTFISSVSTPAKAVQKALRTRCPIDSVSESSPYVSYKKFRIDTIDSFYFFFRILAKVLNDLMYGIVHLLH